MDQVNELLAHGVITEDEAARLRLAMRGGATLDEVLTEEAIGEALVAAGLVTVH